MKQFLAFVKKEFFHILRDPRTMLILLAMPVVQILLFGFALSTDVQNVRVAILTPKTTVDVNRIAFCLGQTSHFDFWGYLHTETDADSLLRNGLADAVLAFNGAPTPQHPFGKEVCIILNGADPNTASMQNTYIAQMIQNTLLRMQEEKGESRPKVQAGIRLLYNPQMKSSYNFVPGIMGMIMILICAMMTSVAIVREKETGTMEILLVSPMKPLVIMVAKMVPYFLLACVNLATILLLARYVLDIPIAGSLFWIIAISLIYILLALAFGLLISTLVETQVAAMLISAIVLMMPIILLSGMIFPRESMPSILQYVSNIIPTTWYISAMRKLMIQGVDISAVIKELCILSGTLATILFAAVHKFKIRLE
ncbi:MAG: ABC transporter permease [Paludibacteraceae bacterium]|nr:ABC transporter permease [Prevotellaceae bacterium]